MKRSHCTRRSPDLPPTIAILRHGGKAESIVLVKSALHYLAGDLFRKDA